MDHLTLPLKRAESILCIPFCIVGLHTLRMDTWRDRAKAQLKVLGISQEKLAEAFGMTPAGMQKWLAGTRQPTLEDINKIAAELQMTPAELTHGLRREESLEGLTDASKQAIRRLIELERSKPLPAKFWAAVEAITDTVSPPAAGQVTHLKSGEMARNGTEG